MHSTRVLGIDPGSLITGFAVVEAQKPSPFHPRDFRVIEAGVLRSKPKHSAGERIGVLHESMYTLMQEFQPGTCVMENVYLGKNFRSALTLGHVRGAYISAAARCKVGVEEIASTTVKKVISGNGHAGKDEVHLALKALLGFDKGNLPFDASDALAIALSFSLSRAWQSKWHTSDFSYKY